MNATMESKRKQMRFLHVTFCRMIKLQVVPAAPLLVAIPTVPERRASQAIVAVADFGRLSIDHPKGQPPKHDLRA